MIFQKIKLLTILIVGFTTTVGTVHGETKRNTLIYNIDECPISPAKLKKGGIDYAGHRGGCENKDYKDIPDNSLLCLKVGLDGINGKKALQEDEGVDFGYLEFDVRETKYGGLVVYHGGFGGRIFHKKKAFREDHSRITYQGINESILSSFNIFQGKNLKVKDLTEDQMSKLYLDGKHCQRVPKLQDYFVKIKDFGLTKKLMVEIKGVSCSGENSAAHKLIEIVSTYERNVANNKPNKKLFDDQKVGFLVYKGDMERLGGELSCWNDALKGKRLRVYETGSEKTPMTNVIDE